jgi:hypothetical protein
MPSGVYIRTKLREPISDETREKMRQKAIGHPCYYSKECLGEEKYSELEKNRRINISKAQIGKKRPNISKAKKGVKNLKSSDTKKRKYASGETVVWNKNLIKEQMPESMYCPETNRKRGDGLRKAYATEKRKVANSIGSGKGGYRDDIGHFVRSRWEANVCRIFNLVGIDYRYEPKNCMFVTEHGTLRLDFFIPEGSIYIEVKGRLFDGCKNKMEDFIRLYPEQAKKTFVLDGESYSKLTKTYKNKIEKWE